MKKLILCVTLLPFYVPRKKTGLSTLRSLWAGLNKGGIFIIHENIKRPIFKEKPYYNMVFEAGNWTKCYLSSARLDIIGLLILRKCQKTKQKTQRYLEL